MNAEIQTAVTALVRAVEAAGLNSDVRSMLEVLASFDNYDAEDDTFRTRPVSGRLKRAADKARALIAAPTAPQAQPVAGQGQAANASEDYDEVRATLEGAHRIMETVSSMERRVGPVGSHARGYTHKITKALRHLDKMRGAAFTAPQAPALVPLTTPEKPGVYVWHEGTSFSLVLVDRRPSEHSRGGVLNGHILKSNEFYGGCAISSWRGGRWVLLHDFEAAGITPTTKEQQ